MTTPPPRRLALAVFSLFSLACVESTATPSAPVPSPPEVAIDLAFRVGADLSDARYTVTVAARGVTLGTRHVTASELGGANGHASLKLPCDPAPAAQPNAVTVTIDALEVNGQALPDDAWADPGPMTHYVTCAGDTPARVPFDHAIGRRVAVGVQYDDVFCSAKFDCRDDFIDPVGSDGTSAVLGFACTAGPGLTTALYLSDIILVCDGHYLQLSPSFEGRRPLIDDLATAAGTYFGEMSYSGLDMCFWDNAVALPMEVGATSSDFKNCHLLARGTVAEGGVDALPGGVTPPDAYYPYVRWDVPITDAAGALTCASHALFGPSGAVSVQYAGAERAAFRWPYACGPMTSPTQVCGGFGPPVAGSSDPATGSGTQIELTQGAPGTVTVTIGGVQKTVQLPAGVALDEEAGCCIDPCCQVAPPGGPFAPQPTLPTVPQGDLLVWLDASVPASYPGTGTVWHDLSGHGNDATIVGSPIFQSDAGGSLTFDGTNYGTLGNLPYNRGAFSVFVWGRMNAAHTGWASGLVTKWLNGNQPANEFWVGATAHSGPSPINGVVQTNQGLVGSLTTVNYSVGTWYNIGLTWDSGVLKGYVDGVLVDTATISGVIPVTTEPILLAAFASGGYRMRASIAAVTIHNRALTPGEIAQSFSTQHARFDLGPGANPIRLVDRGGGVRGWSDGTLGASCRAYRVGDNNRHYQGAIGNGLYRIDPTGGAPFNVYCDMVFDGGGWTRVFFEDTADGFFAANEFEKNKADPLALRYAILNDLESFRRDGAFELKMNWPGHTTWTGYQHWSQTSNPVTDTPGAIPTGVVAHHVAYTSKVDADNPTAWYGLQRSLTTTASLFDGTMNPLGWNYYAVGATSCHVGPSPKCQPAPDEGSAQKVALWVR